MACPALCLGLLLLALGGAQAKVRGVRPELADKYTGGDFGCLDGSKQLSWSQVNDNYCDCADGSDEPGLLRRTPQRTRPPAHASGSARYAGPAGTAACPNGVFYCRNRGHEAKIMSTSFVDDGVCGALSCGWQQPGRCAPIWGSWGPGRGGACLLRCEGVGGPALHPPPPPSCRLLRRQRRAGRLHQHVH